MNAQNWVAEAKKKGEVQTGHRVVTLGEGLSLSHLGSRRRQFSVKYGVDVLEILHNGIFVGGAAVTAAEQGRRSLELFFIDAGQHGRGMGAFAWKAIEEKYPDTEIWETETPYFEQRNIHFYMNICGFHAVEFFHPGYQQKENHPDHLPEGTESEYPVPERSFKFEKRMTPHLFHRS